jgi:cation diffusion facilitator family transporter
MSPARRTALVSVVAAAGLVVLKLVTAIFTHSLGLFSEAAHSSTDLVAALLTFFAVGVAVRPADAGHPYGHGKAEHLSALAEAAFLAAASLFIGWRSIERLLGHSSGSVNAAWYAFVVLGVVLVVDASRMVVMWRGSRRLHSAALQASALHFSSDLAGTLAVLVGLVLVRAAGWHDADSVAALFVAVLVLAAAARLARTNLDVLMDRSSQAADSAARAAIAGLGPRIELRRLRTREAGGRIFADVVIGVPPDAAVGQGHLAADQVEAAVQQALPDADVVVHVEPGTGAERLRERAHAAALGVPRVREIHNVSVLNVGDENEISLHLKLPGDLSLDEAHEIATSVEEAIRQAVPEVGSVQTHLEPLSEEGEGRAAVDEDVRRDTECVLRIVHEETGDAPRELRFLHTDEGLVAFLTLGLEPERTLAEAHDRASAVEARIRSERPQIADVIVHTEP